MTKHSTNKKYAHEGTILKDRFTTEDVFERIIQVADEEVSSKTSELFFSALAAGFAITLTFFLYASMYGATNGHPILKGLLYPLGFVYIVLGGYQLFTENTLPPVALVLERMTTIPSVARVWGLVLLGNLVGGALGAMALAYTGVFTPEAAQAALTMGNSILTLAFGDLFWKGVFAGFIVAGVVWLDYSARDTITRFFMVYFAFLAIPLTGLKHVVITATHMIYMWLTHGVSVLSTMTYVVLPVLLGNILGGVLLVTAVNYFQTPDYLEKNPEKRIPFKQWLFGMDR
jgi:formate/nitrite transporter FocA (FNT family)